MSGHTVPAGHDSFSAALHDGVVLCELANALKPGSVRLAAPRLMPPRSAPGLPPLAKSSSSHGMKGGGSRSRLSSLRRPSPGRAGRGRALQVRGINKGKVAFMQMENISKFLQARLVTYRARALKA